MNVEDAIAFTLETIVNHRKHIRGKLYVSKDLWDVFGPMNSTTSLIHFRIFDIYIYNAGSSYSGGYWICIPAREYSADDGLVVYYEDD